MSRRNCHAQAGLWWRTGNTISSGATRRAPKARIAAASNTRTSLIGPARASALELAPRFQHAPPLRVPLRALLDHHVEVVAQLLAVLGVVLEHGADELARDVLAAHLATAEVVRIQAGGIAHRHGLGRGHHSGRLLHYHAL